MQDRVIGLLLHPYQYLEVWYCGWLMPQVFWCSATCYWDLLIRLGFL